MELLFLEEVDSTNKYAKEHIDELKDKTLIYTNRQYAGKGRLQRVWSDLGEENVFASIVLKPSADTREVYSNLTQYLCVVLAETFEEYKIIPKIKWPNDIQINGKKISGILAEAVIERGCLKGLIIGFGVNLNVQEEKLSQINQPATSLNIEIGEFVNRKFFLKKLLDKFCLRYDRFIEEGFLLIKEDYIRRAGFLNKEVTVRSFDTDISGIAKDITDNGALKIVDRNNIEHVLLIGDIL